MRLRTKIILLTVAVTLGLGLGSSLLVSRMMHGALQNELRDQAVLAVQGLAEHVTHNVIDGEVIDARDAVRRMVERSQSVRYAYIIDFDGRLFTHTFEGGFPKVLARMPHQHSIVSAQSPAVVRLKTNTGSVLEIGYPLIEGMRAHVHIGMDEDRTHARIAALRNRIIGLTLVLAAVGITTGIFLSGRIARPLSKLADAMRDFGERREGGELESRSGGREIAHLTRTFNQMISARNQAEEALRCSEENLRTTLNSIGDAVIATDTRGVIARMNPVAEKLTGWLVEEAQGKSLIEVFNIVNVQTREPAVNPVGDVLENGEMVGLANHTILIARDGVEYQIADSAAPIRDAAGATSGVVLVFRDVTEDYRMREQLRESEERFRGMFDNMSSGVAVYEAVDDGKDFVFVDFNPAGERIEGIAREDLIGRRVTDVFPGIEQHGLLDVIRRVWRTGEAEHDPVSIYKDERIMGWRENFVYRLPSGEVGVVYDDVTERKQAEEERERLMHAIEQAAEAVVITDAKATIQYTNPAFEQITGYTREEMLGQNPRVLKSGKHDHAFYEEIWDTLTHGETWSGRFVNKKKDGTLYTEDATISPVRDPSGKTVNYVAVKRDITHELLLEERLSQAQKMEAIGQLAGGVAHDFNNQLAGIINYSELLLRRLEDDKERGYADMILNTAQRSADLTGQLLAFSRKAELRITNVDVHALVAEVVSLLSHTIDRRITIKQRLEASPTTTMGDASQLQSALLNLAINARDAMPEGGELIIGTEVVTLDKEFCRTHPHGVEPGQFLLVSVSDTGTGMDEESLAHIFEPFFTTKGVGAGTGLGLAAVYGTVRSHKGTIHVYSEPGHGSVFKVYLPLAAAGNDDAVSAEPTTTAAAGPARILFVDDEKSVRMSSCEALRGLGYEMVPCENGAEAVECYRESWRDVDLVILDMVMPKMNGHDAFRAMHKVNPGVKVLLLSGYSLDSRIQAVLDEGVLDYLQKPFRLDDLYAKVAQLLAQGQQKHPTKGNDSGR